MKRNFRILACFLLIAILLSGSAGCKKEPTYETFALYEVTDSGEKFSAADLQADLDLAGENLKLEDTCYILWYDDGTALIHSLGVEEKMKYNDTELWSDNLRATYTRAGDMITIFEGTSVMVYKKK